MRLSDDVRTFQNAIRLTANAFHMSEAYAEKDYWGISVLKEIVTRKPDIVFKGGTSLSKCHHVISRFSEDIDISCSDLYLTQGQRRKNTNSVRESIAAVGLTINDPEKIHSRRVFNRFVLPYQSVVASSTIDKTVIVELAT